MGPAMTNVWVVQWEMPWEDGGFSSVWSTPEGANAEADRLRQADRNGVHFDVVEVTIDEPRDGR